MRGSPTFEERRKVFEAQEAPQRPLLQPTGERHMFDERRKVFEYQPNGESNMFEERRGIIRNSHVPDDVEQANPFSSDDDCSGDDEDIDDEPTFAREQVSLEQRMQEKREKHFERKWLNMATGVLFFCAIAMFIRFKCAHYFAVEAEEHPVTEAKPVPKLNDTENQPKVKPEGVVASAKQAVDYAVEAVAEAVGADSKKPADEPKQAPKKEEEVKIPKEIEHKPWLWPNPPSPPLDWIKGGNNDPSAKSV